MIKAPRDSAKYAEFVRVCREAAIKENLERHLSEEEFAAKVLERSGGTWEYARGFVSTDGHFIARCPKCGAEREFACSTIRTKTFKGTSCANCRIIDRRQRQGAKTARFELERQQDKGTQLEFAICKQCGALFVPRGGRKEYCSTECGKKWHNSRRDHIENRRRWKAEQTKDHDISLEKLFKRDGGICYICGQECDWNDYTKDGGTFIAGDRYPSVEHVVPLSKGGEHSWDNVRLACRRCNYLKRDTSPIQK